MMEKRILPQKRGIRRSATEPRENQRNTQREDKENLPRDAIAEPSVLQEDMQKHVMEISSNVPRSRRRRPSKPGKGAICVPKKRSHPEKGSEDWLRLRQSNNESVRRTRAKKAKAIENLKEDHEKQYYKILDLELENKKLKHNDKILQCQVQELFNKNNELEQATELQGIIQKLQQEFEQLEKKCTDRQGHNVIGELENEIEEHSEDTDKLKAAFTLLAMHRGLRRHNAPGQ